MIKKALKNFKLDISNKYNSLFENKFQKAGIKKMDLKKIRVAAPEKINEYLFSDHTVSFHNGEEFLHGVYEIFVEELYKTALRENPFIIDCGAHIGLSVIYFKKQYPKSAVIAFEPDEKNFFLLSKNVASYNFSEVELRKEAVWVEDTLLNFSGEGNMSSKIENSHSGKNNALVKASRLKNLIDKPIDLLKIDIEGAEYPVIKDIQDRLHFIANIFLEYHGLFANNHQLVELLQILTKNGFSFYIKEAHPSYKTPFYRTEKDVIYDVQLNIFCFKK